MTANLHALPVRERASLRCPECGGLVPCAGGPEYATPLGIRRYRKCAQCGEAVLTTEQVAAWRYDSVLPVPPETPPWALRLCAWIVRAACWVGRRR